MIESIEEFSDELKSKALGEGCVLLQSNAPKVDTGIGKRVPGRISKMVVRDAHRTAGGRCKAFRIKEHRHPVGVGATTAEIRIADFIGVACAPVVQVVVAKSDGWLMSPAVELGDALQLPAVDKLIRNAADLPKESTTLTEGQFIDVAERRSVSDIELGLTTLRMEVVRLLVRGALRLDISAIAIVDRMLPCVGDNER